MTIINLNTFIGTPVSVRLLH